MRSCRPRLLLFIDRSAVKGPVEEHRPNARPGLGTNPSDAKWTSHSVQGFLDVGEHFGGKKLY